MKAELEDLLNERWLRMRERGEIVWTTKDGEEIPIKELSDTHLDNIINMIRRVNEFNDIAAEFNAAVNEFNDAAREFNAAMDSQFG